MIRIISFCNVHFIASLCKACERFAPLIFHFNQESAHCGSSLFTASLALEVAEHSHTHDGPSRYVLDLVPHRVAHPHQYHQQYVCAAPTVFRARRLHLPGATGDATTQSLFPRLLRIPLPQPRRKEGRNWQPTNPRTLQPLHEGTGEPLP